MHQGEKIKRYLEDQPGGLTAFARKTKKVRSYFYYNFGKQDLSSSFLQLLAKYNVDIKKALEDRQTPEGMIEIPVAIDSKKVAYIYLPEDCTNKEIEKVARVLRAYKK